MSSWFDIDSISESIKSSVDQASKLVEDMNLDHMQEFQEREENDPEFAAHNAAVRQHRRLMDELERQERLAKDQDKKQEEYFQPVGMWDEPIFAEQQVGIEDDDDGDESCTEDNESGDEYLSDEKEEEEKEGEEERCDDSAEIDLIRQQMPLEPFDHPQDSLFSISAEDTVANLPEMPTINFSLKSSNPNTESIPISELSSADDESMSNMEHNKTIDIVESSDIENSKDSLITDRHHSVNGSYAEPTVLSTRLTVTTNWKGNTDRSRALSNASENRKMYFDKVDEEVDLESDPILKQVAMNKANPGMARTNTMKDVMGKIMEPFKNMAEQKAKNSAQKGGDGNRLHYGDLPFEPERQREPDLASAASNVVSNCIVLGKLIFAALLSIFEVIFPFLGNIISHLKAVFGRLVAAGSSHRNGEYVPVSERVSNVRWCMWTHISSKRGLGTLTVLLIVYSYWKFNHEVWD